MIFQIRIINLNLENYPYKLSVDLYGHKQLAQYRRNSSPKNYHLCTLIRYFVKQTPHFWTFKNSRSNFFLTFGCS